jgi:hypothetical protein
MSEFAYVLDLLQERGIPAVATAVEQHGVQGWDRFGRFRTFKPGSPEACAVLGVLAAEVAYRDRPAGHAQSPLDDAVGRWPDTPLAMGWAPDRVPAMPAPMEQHEKPRRQADITKEYNSLLRLCAALMKVLNVDVRDGTSISQKADSLLVVLDDSAYEFPVKNTLVKMLPLIADQAIMRSIDK